MKYIIIAGQNFLATKAFFCCPKVSLRVILVQKTKSAFPNYPVYRWVIHYSSPWTPIEKDLGDSKVVLISSGGVYHNSQSAFRADRKDLTFRVISRDVSIGELKIIHDNYDHADAEKDVNCIFPIERLSELVQGGFIKELSEINFSFMGRIFKRTQLLEDMAPYLIRRIKDFRLDLVLLVPA